MSYLIGTANKQGEQERLEPLSVSGSLSQSGGAHTRFASESDSIHGALEGVCILLIEDTPDMRALISRMLTKSGAKVFAAESAKTAREFLSSHRPDVIVSDIAMPEEDGLSFLHGLRKEEVQSGQHIPAIALTAFIGNEYRHLTLRAGFEEHLCKPVASSKLINTIVNVLRAAANTDHH